MKKQIESLSLHTFASSDRSFLALLIVFFLLSIAAHCQTLSQPPDVNLHPLMNKPIPDFADTTLRGAQFNSENYKHSIVIFQFWTLSCAPCVMEIPELNILAGQYKENITVVSFLEDKRADVLKRITIDEFGYKLKRRAFNNDVIGYEIITDAGPVRELLGSNYMELGFPLTYIVKNGILRYIHSAYRMSIGNPQPEDSENYKLLKSEIDTLITED